MFVSTGLAYRRTNQLSRLAHDGQIFTRGDDEDTRRRGWHGNISVRLATFVTGSVEIQPLDTSGSRRPARGSPPHARPHPQ